MMEIYLNGEPRRVEPAITVARLLDEIGMTGRRIAVEINRAIVPRSRYTELQIQPGDRVEIVQAIGGG
jgi:sulfur carrier protein